MRQRNIRLIGVKFLRSAHLNLHNSRPVFPGGEGYA
jgi:hypothetical protein